MSDPYNVLGVSANSSDDEIKKAYRDLARKYHPDNYVDNPLADLAQEKMKEINEAYDTITKERAESSARQGSYSSARQGSYSSARQASSYGEYSQQTGYNQGGYANYGYSTGNPTYDEIRRLISLGNVVEAERRLNMLRTRDAEWNFLMGRVFERKGWYDEARNYYRVACALSQNNREYADAYRRMENTNTAYSNMFNRSSGTCDICTTLICANCMCDICCGR